METKKLNRSIFITGALVVMIIIQHLLMLFEITQLSISMTVNLIALLFTILFFVRFQHNFNYFLKIDNIKWQVFGLIMAFTFLILIAEITKGLKHKNAITNIKDLPEMDKILTIILGFIGLIVVVILIVEYIILGRKLVKNSIMPEVRQLGFSFYLIPISFIGALIFDLNKNLKPFSHIFIIFELLPYWITYKIYKKILNSINENNETGSNENETL